jgi:hypothetical protein
MAKLCMKSGYKKCGDWGCGHSAVALTRTYLNWDR